MKRNLVRSLIALLVVIILTFSGCQQSVADATSDTVASPAIEKDVVISPPQIAVAAAEVTEAASSSETSSQIATSSEVTTSSQVASSSKEESSSNAVSSKAESSSNAVSSKAESSSKVTSSVIPPSPKTEDDSTGFSVLPNVGDYGVSADEGVYVIELMDSEDYFVVSGECTGVELCDYDPISVTCEAKGLYGLKVSYPGYGIFYIDIIVQSKSNDEKATLHSSLAAR